ncbi:MAG: HypC/HybG/HupF family hydrogenase formation chaperone [Austwickia sp.]|jgi:hydrogenase expression/formation protein HypC|nr:MAG: HypC/HybG/HupF family hydrogenase formation chaperone [Austwickia sp.]
MCLGLPGKILRTWQDGEARLGEADFAGDHRVIRLDLVPELQAGDWTLLHAGFALQRLDEEEARLTLEALRTAGALASDDLAGADR